MMKKDEMKKWIATNNYHVAIAKHIVKKNASNVKTKEENNVIIMTGFSSFIGQACNDFVMNNFQDEIFNDLCNEVYISLHELIEKNLFVIENDTPNYKTYTYITKSGEQKERSSYFDLYRTIENFLYSEKKNFTMITTKNDSKLYEEYEEVVKDKDDKPLKDKKGNVVTVTKKVSIAKNNESNNINSNKRIKYYVSILRFEKKVSETDNGEEVTLYDEVASIPEKYSLYDNVLQRDEVIRYFRYIKVSYPKYYSDIVKIFESLLNGFTYEEIEKYYDIKVSRVKYLMPIIRKTWNDKESVSIKESISDSMYCDTTKNKGTTYYINRDKRKTVIPTIKKSGFEKFETPSIPLSCGIVDTYEIFKARFEKNEKSDNLYIDNAMKYNSYRNVWGTKSKTVCIMYDNTLFARLKCSYKAKEIMKKKLENVAI